MQMKIRVTILSAFLLLLTNMSLSQEHSDLPWVKKVGARKTPASKKMYWVNDFGAVKDGSTVTTRSIQQAIDACAQKGGGIVAFRPGTYLMGSIFIKSGVHLR